MRTPVSSLEHLESKSLRGDSVIKLYFQPYAHVNAAIAQVTALCQTLLRPLPTGITPPLSALCGLAMSADKNLVAVSAVSFVVNALKKG